MPQMLALLETLEVGKIYTTILMMGTKDVSRGESRKMMRLQDNVNFLLEELRVYFDPAVLTICTVPYNMLADQNGMSIDERVRHINVSIRQTQKRSVDPMMQLDVARMMEDSLPQNASSDGIRFDRPRGTEWLSGVFQRHLKLLESDLVEAGQFTFGTPLRPSFCPAGPVADRLGGGFDSRESSRSSRSRQLGSTPMERDEVESFTPQSSVVSSVVMVDDIKKPGDPGETSEALERVKNLDLEDLACRQELVEKNLSHEDLSNHYCVDWLKMHEAHFYRDKTLETAHMTGIPRKSIMGPVNYRSLKELGKPGLIVEQSKHRTRDGEKHLKLRLDVGQSS